jgi:2-polyprenyl-3-methyl-5-hydroxy-6-metoxy-1,4-benzoquinol methylase
MYWDDLYNKDNLVWGEGPSKLAVAAVKYLRKYRPGARTLSVLDIGCGYGRDSFYLQDNLECRVLGIDVSEKAIDMASKKALEVGKKDVKFQCYDFRALGEDKYDVIFCSHVYHLLQADERRVFRETVTRSLKPGGLLFLSTLSVRDPEHYGKGRPVPGEPNSFVEKVYHHFCTREELMQDFGFLAIKALYEREYDEPRATGEAHHHILWILNGEYISNAS